MMKQKIEQLAVQLEASLAAVENKDQLAAFWQE